MRKLRDDLQDFLAPFRRKISLLLSRAVIKLVRDTSAVQLNQVSLLKEENRDDVERFQEYGFTSVPLPGCEALVGFLGGDRNHGVVIATEDRRYRLKALQGGEVALYTDEGDFIHFKRGNVIEISTKTLRINAETKVEVTSPEVIVNCDTAQVTAAESASIDAPQVLVTCEEATVDASSSVDMTAPQVNIDAATGVNMNTPALIVTGTVQASGIGAGGVPIPGQVADATGTMSALRNAYNSHTHPAGTPNTGTTSNPA